MLRWCLVILFVFMLSACSSLVPDKIPEHALRGTVGAEPWSMNYGIVVHCSDRYVFYLFDRKMDFECGSFLKNLSELLLKKYSYIHFYAAKNKKEQSLAVLGGSLFTFNIHKSLLKAEQIASLDGKFQIFEQDAHKLKAGLVAYSNHENRIDGRFEVLHCTQKHRHSSDFPGTI